jgi:branched-chain amino acid transport system ATP-binding protein
VSWPEQGRTAGVPPSPSPASTPPQATKASTALPTLPVIEMRQVHAAYGRIEVLRGVDLAVTAGTVLALLGPNGAGKSTVIKVASGRLVPSSGCFHVLGRHVNDFSSDALARAGICTIPEGRAVFPNLTVTENLRMMTYSGTSRRYVEEQAFARFPRLAERRKQLAGTMSGGEQQILAMARALGAEPAVLLLDEISMGLAPLIVEELYDVVDQIAAEGVAIVLTEQFAQAALGIADRVGLMSQGRIVAISAPDELPDDLAATYLGGGLGATPDARVHA